MRLRVGSNVSSKVVSVLEATLIRYHSIRESQRCAVVNVPRAMAMICHVPMASSPLPEMEETSSLGMSMIIKYDNKTPMEANRSEAGPLTDISTIPAIENDALDSIRLMANPAKTRNTIPTPTNPTRAISALTNLTSEVPVKISSSIGNIHQIRGAFSLIE